ncbi:MAG: hypothetical protein ABIY52_01380 [Gemmatimonadaceae bacterium]
MPSYRLLLALLIGATSSAFAQSNDAAVNADLDKLRNATRAFQDLDSAVAAGYPRTVADCLIHEHHGAMGYHHVNRGYLTATPVVEKPQILLYERMPDGAYKLNGVEFIVPYRLYARDSVPPVLFGRKLAHEDNLNIWYLHVWAFSGNADGIFANFNPGVSCGTAGKVYTPFSKDP